MKIQQSWFVTISIGFVLALLGAAWISFAPVQLGGQAAYVIVNGNSMEPLYHSGDLVIIHAQPDYQIGDIVTYRHPDIGPVIHRIVGRDVERFVFKGDHNNFIDPYRPLRSELIGTSWIYLPSAGAVLSQLRTPLYMAILAAVVGVMIMAPSIRSANQPIAWKRGRRQARPLPAQIQRGSNTEALLTACVALAFVSIALAAFAFTRPAARDAADELTYRQNGVFSYSAAAPSGLYDSNTIQTGEPLFPQLTSNARFNFDYQLATDAPVDLHGTYQLVAEVAATNGWQRTIELWPTTAFSGGTFSASGTLNFAQVQALIGHFEQQTGLLRQQYTLTIVPKVFVEGTLAGQALADAYAPRLEFRLDQTQLQLPATHGDAADPLKPSKPGLIKYTHVEPNIIALWFFKPEVSLARWIAVGGLVLALLGLLWLGLHMLRAGQLDEAAQIRSKYSALLIDIAGGTRPTNERVVEIATIGDLAKLAEKNGQMILHEASGMCHRYIVQDTSAIYCYRVDRAAQLSGAAIQRSPARAPGDPAAAPQPGEISAELLAAAHWQARFLEALRIKPTVSEACRTAGVRLTTVYEEREHVPGFAQAWDDARADALMAMCVAIDANSANKPRRTEWIKHFARGSTTQ